MSSALLADPIALPFSAIWARIADAGASLSASVRGLRRPSPEKALVFKAAERYASDILEAQDVSDLRRRVMNVAEDARYWKLRSKLVQASGVEQLPSGAKLEAHFRTDFGETQLVREIARLLAAQFDILRSCPELVASAVNAPVPPDVIVRSMRDFRVPTVVSDLMAKCVASEVATLALVATLIDSGRWVCAPWLRLALLEMVRDGTLATLKLLDLVPGLSVPVDVLPLAERLDADELQRESEERARFVVPSQLSVDPAYAQRVLDLLEADDEPSAGVRALFSA
jgi:hypothetical protein